MSEPIALLLVDDEPRNLDVLEAILADPGYRLLRAENADQALKLLLENDVAAIVLDIKMPGMSGLELAAVIQATRKFRQVPILFMTAYLLDDQNVLAGYGVGAVDYLSKPVNPEVLRYKVAVFADLFRKTRALAELNETLEARVRERTAELERSEAALRAADRQKDEFLAVLSHELRNPLAPLSIGIDLLLKHAAPRGPALVGETLDRMNRQLSHMVRIIDDLLDVSRITSGSFELKRAPTDLAAVVTAACDAVRPFVEARQQVLTVATPRGIVGHVDAMRVTQVLVNLLHNATKFTPKGGTFGVELEAEGDDAVLRVVDRGVGIAADQIEHAFQMFARVDRASVATEGGLGIGLAVARRIAQLHGGSLTATSDGPGRGTTFTLRLPLRVATGSPRVVPSIPPPSIHPAARKLRVVVIDDNADIAETLGFWLEDQGHQVWIGDRAATGIELIERHAPELVFCDIGLPDADGVEVCRKVRGRGGVQPVMVALTGWGREGDRRRTKEAGFDDHIVKPVAVEQLASILESVSARAADTAPPRGS